MCKKISKFYLHIFLISLIAYLYINVKPKVRRVTQYDRFRHDLRHILIWSTMDIKDEGQHPFLKAKCQYKNCYLTKNRTLFHDIRVFDAILFNSTNVSSNIDIPLKRSSSQRYIFVSKESSERYPVCYSQYDNFFNWSWTYRTDSEIRMKYFSFYVLNGGEVFTNDLFKWLTKMDPIDNTLKEELTSKFKAAAWFADECNTLSNREYFARNLRRELKKYNLTLDVYGKCGDMTCRRKTMAVCNWKLRKNYYFYLAFEDSFAKDFITDTVLHALKNNVVPIVYGGADYNKFLPPNSYINGLRLGEESVAKLIYIFITNKYRYYDYFRWKNYYKVKQTPVIDICDLCYKLNTPEWLQYKMSYPEFREWWNPDYKERCGIPKLTL